MKNITVILLFILIGWTSHAVAQATFPTENANWCYYSFDDKGQSYGIGCISPMGSEVVGGLTYSKIVYSQHPYYNSEEALYREQNGRFYVIPQDSINEILVYDFNLQVGDLFQTDWGWGITDSIDLIVQSVDTITTLDGVSRKKIELVGGVGGQYNGRWLEGIGFMDWVFIYPAYVGSLGGGYIFICHARTDTIVYPAWADSSDCGLLSSVDGVFKEERNVKLYPNPANKHLQIDLQNMQAKKLEIIDVRGRIILEQKINNQYTIIQLPNDLFGGLYLVKFTKKDDSFFVKKFIKE